MPFSNIRNDGALLIEIAINDQRPTHPGIIASRRGLNDSMWGLMQDCWAVQPSDRPVIEIIPGRLLSAYSLSPQISQLTSSASFNSNPNASIESSIEAFRILRHVVASNDLCPCKSINVTAFDQTLYQRCSIVRARLLEVPGFDVYFSIFTQTSHESYALYDPISELWDYFALGAPLCFLYNLLPNVKPIVKSYINPDSIDILDKTTAESCIAHFVTAIIKTDAINGSARLFSSGFVGP